ncbi:SprT family zinc-dependent metalloprotease [Campylobacter sp.]|uniref:M48 family metallopeptidase n=1 Tax=Campylobacter sp. TaxID=205 RepID=UPI0026DBD096|nr:SprT family zinc-dependent metalloprotease [Campylobacter sp.]MDO4673871.1 SprT family zinc-dependent metalloprotease [Campylobacter sp.]
MAGKKTGLESFAWKGWRIFYQKKPVKNLRLRLDDAGRFRLSLPLFCPEEKVVEFLSKNEAWMGQIWARFKEREGRKDELLFLGRGYRVLFDANLKKTRFEKNLIKSPSKEDLDKFLRQNARIIFLHFLKKWGRKTGLFHTHLSIKTMRTRWGSCNSKKGYINLNLRLLQKNLRAIEYVILHELAHLKHPNHSEEFYAFLAENMSDFRQREGEFY